MTAITLVIAAAILGTGAAGDSAPVRPASARHSLSASQMFALADRSRDHGDSRLAETIYRALTGNPSPDVRAEARFQLAKLIAAAGRQSEAAALLRQVVDERPNARAARLELAGLLAKMGDEDAALRQLRAVRSGRLPPEVARMIDRFSEAVRARKDFGGSFEIGFAPDNNINRATRSDTLGTVLGDFNISKDGKAKSGTGLEMRGQAYRRFGLFEGANLLTRLSGSGDFYGHGDFNQMAADLSVGPEFRVGRTSFSVEAGVTGRWFAAKIFTRELHAGATVRQPVGSRTLAIARIGASRIDNRLNRLQDGRDYSLQLSAEHALGTRTGLVASASGDRFSARDPGYSTKSGRLSLQGWRDLGRSTLVAGVEFGKLRADERLSLFPERREDRFTSYSLGIVMRGLSVEQFAPSIRVTRERNRSNIAFYDYQRTRTEFSVARAF